MARIGGQRAMTTRRKSEPAGDMIAALRLIRLGGMPSPSRAEIDELTENGNAEELGRGCVTLVTCWLDGMGQPEVVRAVVSRVRKLGLFSEETLDDLDVGLMGAMRGESPADGRGQQSPLSRDEIAAWLCATWFVADLIDFAHGEGTVADVTLRAFEQAAEDARKGSRRCGFCDAHEDLAVLIASAGAYICDRCISIQLVGPLPEHLAGDDRRCSFCGHRDRPMALGAGARICEACLHAGRDALRQRRRRGDVGQGRP